MFVDSGFSDLYCLYGESAHDGAEKQNCLEFCYDLEFSYNLENVFFRSVSGEGQVVKDPKFSFLLKGRGELPVFFSDDLKFWTNRIIKNKDGKVLAGQNLTKSQSELRKKLNNGYFFREEVPLEGGQFFVPIFNVLIVSQKVKDKQWFLEFKEK